MNRLLNDVACTPHPQTLQRVARVLGVSDTWLTADARPRELTPLAREELLHCVRTLGALARGLRIDARTEPNARRARGGYRVRGRSLCGFGLLDGDVVSVKPLQRSSLRGAVGSIVLFRLNGALYLKQLTVTRGGVVVLRSAQTGYEPITLHAADDFEPLGQVVASVRNLVGRGKINR